jgi:hypothetical protein
MEWSFMLCRPIRNKYYWHDKITKNKMDGACSTYGERRGAFKALVGKPKGRTPIERLRRTLVDNIKMGL